MSILSDAGILLYDIIKESRPSSQLSNNNAQRLLHESRSFIIKGLVSATVYHTIHNYVKSQERTYSIVAQVYNKIYQNCFDKIWKPRCSKVVDQERAMGITNFNKRIRRSLLPQHYS